MSTPLVRNILIPLRRTRSALVASAIAIVVGLVAMVGGGLAGGAAGVSLAIGLTELVNLVILVPQTRSAVALEPPMSLPLPPQ
jgi:PST family polysaccharide transporter